MNRRSFVISGASLIGYNLLPHDIESVDGSPQSIGSELKGASKCYRQFTFDFNWLGGAIEEYFNRADPISYADFCKRINLDAVVLLAVSHHGYCAYETAVGEKWPGMKGDWLGRQIDELHKRGIAAIAYITLARNWKYEKEHPEYTWPRRSERLICLNSPYLDLVIAYSQEVLRNYPVGSLRYDTLLQAPDHHCEGCKAYYRQLYGEKLPTKWQDTDWRRQLDFQRASSTRAVARLRKACKDIKPSVETWQNGFIGGDFDDNNLNAGRLQDMGYVEVGDPFRQVLLAGTLRLKGVIVGKTLRSPVRRLCMALGAHCYSYYSVNRKTLLPDDKSWFLNDLAPFYQMVSEVQPYLEGAKPLPYFGIVYSEATRYQNYMYDRSEYMKLLRAITEAYLSRSLPVEFVNNLNLPNENLAGFKILVLPETSGLKEEELEGLRRYVREGGQLLVTGTALLYDEKGFRLNNFALAKEMGITFIRRSSEKLAVKFSGGWANKYLPMTVNPQWWPHRDTSPYIDLTVMARVQVIEGQTVVAAKLDGEIWPVVHVNQYGRGTIAYSALSNSLELLQTVIETMNGSVPLSVTQGKMAMLTHQLDQKRWILHLLSDGDFSVKLNKAWVSPIPDRVIEQYPKQGFEYQMENTTKGVTVTVKGEATDRLLVLTNEGKL